MSRIVGLLICLGCVIAGAAFIAGIVVQYDKVAWALLVPVAVIVGVVLMLGFWIGWIMAITKIESPPEISEDKEKEAKS
jgi:ribose/xylose/arabinose/galactoside ABC-type transport system permease subunit